MLEFPVGALGLVHGHRDERVFLAGVAISFVEDLTLMRGVWGWGVGKWGDGRLSRLLALVASTLIHERPQG